MKKERRLLSCLLLFDNFSFSVEKLNSLIKRGVEGAVVKEDGKVLSSS